MHDRQLQCADTGHQLDLPEVHQHAQSHWGHGELSWPGDQPAQHAEILGMCSTSSESALAKLPDGKSREVQEKHSVVLSSDVKVLSIQQQFGND